MRTHSMNLAKQTQEEVVPLNIRIRSMGERQIGQASLRVWKPTHRNRTL